MLPLRPAHISRLGHTNGQTAPKCFAAAAMRNQLKAMTRQQMQPNRARNPAELPWYAHYNAKDIAQNASSSPTD